MIVIPMAGNSSRFFKEGYSKPKYMLEAKGQTLFEHSVKSFTAYFETESFLFIVRDEYNTVDFVKMKVIELGIRSYHISVLSKKTRGQAETVTLGLKDYLGSNKIDNESLLIFNIDTFRPGYLLPDIAMKSDGYLEVFEGEGSNWSFVEAKQKDSTLIVKTTEKEPISNLCCTGLYFFKNVNEYFKAYNHYLTLPSTEWQMGELYVAPLYNYLIESGLEVHYHLIKREQVIFCGVPQEYIDFCSKKIPS